MLGSLAPKRLAASASRFCKTSTCFSCEQDADLSWAYFGLSSDRHRGGRSSRPKGGGNDRSKKFGFAPLGGDDSEVKRKIFGENICKIHGFDPKDLSKQGVNMKDDKLAKAKEAYLKEGAERTNAFYGFIDNKDISFKRS